MADLGQIPQIAPFQPDVDPTNTAVRWKKWLDRFENLIIAINVTDNDRKKALLLHLAGEFGFEVYEGLVIPKSQTTQTPPETTPTQQRREL